MYPFKGPGLNVPSPSRTNRAFTFIEIILVVVILSVLAAVSIPNFSGSFGNIILTSTANQIASLMRYAQGRAVTHRQGIRFVLGRDMRSYRLRQQPVNERGEPVMDDDETLPGRWGRTFTVPAELELEATQRTFEFYPDGRIEGGRLFLCRRDKCMTLSTRDQRSRVLILNGRVE